MKFRIRFAEQIVGVFIIVALVSIALVIVLLGSSQRWFNKDVAFHTVVENSTGISKNMPLTYKGFTIGTVKDFYLDVNDKVTVWFTVYSDYTDRVIEGSMVEIAAGLIPALGNSFVFHPGKGTEPIQANELVPSIHSHEAQRLIRQGLAEVPQTDDSISQLLTQVTNILGALESGGDDGLGLIINNVNDILETLPSELMAIVGGLETEVTGLLATVNGLLEDVNPIINDVAVVTSKMQDPDWTVFELLDAEGLMYASLVDSLQSLSGMLNTLDTSLAFIPSQLPQLAAVIIDLQEVMHTANDAMTAVMNLPILRGGVPERMDIQTVGTSPREIRF
jgi:phospholipid/cholesterol/gamma-HCH transport system substrate-binding protein